MFSCMQQKRCVAAGILRCPTATQRSSCLKRGFFAVSAAHIYACILNSPALRTAQPGRCNQGCHAIGPARLNQPFSCAEGAFQQPFSTPQTFFGMTDFYVPRCARPASLLLISRQGKCIVQVALPVYPKSPTHISAKFLHVFSPFQRLTAAHFLRLAWRQICIKLLHLTP